MTHEQIRERLDRIERDEHAKYPSDPYALVATLKLDIEIAIRREADRQAMEKQEKAVA